MSQKSVEVVRRSMDACVGGFNARRDPTELAGINDHYPAADVVYEEDPAWPDAGLFRGREAVLRRFLEYADLMHLTGINRGAITDTGDAVLAELRLEMLASGAGAVEFVWTYTMQVEDGRVTHFRAWYDPDQAARAAGLRE